MSIVSFNRGESILNYCSRIAQNWLPSVCLLCGARASAANLCSDCREELPWLPAERCPRCAVPTLAGEICGACLASPPHFDRVLVPCAYDYPLDRVLHAFKFAGNLTAAALFADLMLGELRAVPRPDLIIAMPLSRNRLRSRGFNQALELARIVARALDVPLNCELCERVLDTVPQSELAWGERARNIRGAFVCTQALHGESVAIVDDVATTGATMNELARVLKKCGAGSVQGWVATRTLERAS